MPKTHQVDIAGAFAQQADTRDAVGGLDRAQRQVQHARAGADHGIAEDLAIIRGGAEDQRQAFPAQFEVRGHRDRAEPGARMTGHQFPVQIEQVEPAFARCGDDIPQGGRIGVRQEVDIAAAALHAGEGGGDKDFNRIGVRALLRQVRFLDRIIAGRQGQQAGA